MRSILVLLSLIAFAIPSLAADKYAPLPKRLLAAKKIYLDNQGGRAEFADKAYSELNKWKRFEFVETSSEADLILRITTEESAVGAMTTTNGDATASGSDSNVYASGTSRSRTRVVTSGTTFLTFIDPKTGDVVWRDSRPWGGWSGATIGMLKDLKKRIDSNEKTKK